MIWIAYITGWIVTGILVGYGIYLTGDMRLLWFLLLPSMSSIHIETKDEDKEKI